MNCPIQVAVISHGPPACLPLQHWLADNALPHWYSHAAYDVDTARNAAVVRFLREDVPAGRLYLLMMDHNKAPVSETAAILSEPGDVLYCGVAGRDGSLGHWGDEDFGAACCRLSAVALARIAPPWFLTAYDGTHTRRLACECNHFHRAALAAGFRPRMAGVIARLAWCVPTSRQSSRLAF